MEHLINALPRPASGTTPLLDAGGSGGALVHSGELDTLINVDFSNNRASNEGPAVLSLGAITDMANCTFGGNVLLCEPGTFWKVPHEPYYAIICHAENYSHIVCTDSR